jgi:uracil-DNA glycosylase
MTRTLEEAAREAAGCTKCKLARLGRTQVVYGVGAADADLLLIGEAPGSNEDKQGEPFVGAAGQLLNRVLGEIGLRREDVYIANVLMCRPPGNRDPEPDEIESCTPWLVEKISVIQPRVLVTLGNFASSSASSHGRHASCSARSGLRWIRRLPRGSNLKCFTTFVR